MFYKEKQHFFIEIINGKYYCGFAIPLSHYRFEKVYLGLLEEYEEAFFGLIKNSYPNNVQEYKKETIVYIHGWWGDRPRFVAYNLYNMQQYYVQNPDSPIVNTLSIIWHCNHPSYWYGRKACAKQGAQASDIFFKIINTLKSISYKKNMHLLTHSMGNYFFENLLKMSLEKPLFKEWIMAAADISHDFFERKQEALTVSEHITLVNNKNDVLLFLSKLANRQKRLGNQRMAFVKDKYPEINMIEVSQIKDVRNNIARIGQHIHYITSATVMLKINERLKTGSKVSQALI